MTITIHKLRSSLTSIFHVRNLMKCINENQLIFQLLMQKRFFCSIITIFNKLSLYKENRTNTIQRTKINQLLFEICHSKGHMRNNQCLRDISYCSTVNQIFRFCCSSFFCSQVKYFVIPSSTPSVIFPYLTSSFVRQVIRLFFLYNLVHVLEFSFKISLIRNFLPGFLLSILHSIICTFLPFIHCLYLKIPSYQLACYLQYALFILFAIRHQSLYGILNKYTGISGYQRQKAEQLQSSSEDSALFC